MLSQPLKTLSELLGALPATAVLDSGENSDTSRESQDMSYRNSRYRIVANFHKLAIKSNEWHLWQMQKNKKLPVGKSSEQPEVRGCPLSLK